MTLYALCTMALTWTLACAEPDAGDDSGAGGDTGVGGEETGDPGLPFTELVSGSNSSHVCGPSDSKDLACSEGDLGVLVARSYKDLASLMDENIAVDAPAVDLTDDIALVSYLPWCPSLDMRLHVDRLEVVDTDLQMAEELVDTDGGDALACLYNVVTIPVVDFDTISATLTVVGAR